MMIQDQRGRGALELAVQHLMQAAAQSPDLAGLFSLFNTRTPRVYAGIDRVQSEILGVPASRAFETLEIYLGLSFINEFSLVGRAFRVTAQADSRFCQDLHAIANLKTRNDRSEEHTSELQSLMRNSYAVFCLKTKKLQPTHIKHNKL